MKKYLVTNFILLRPTQLACYAQFQSIISCFILMLVGLVFGILANYSWGRTLLGRLLKCNEKWDNKTFLQRNSLESSPLVSLANLVFPRRRQTTPTLR